MMTRCIYVMSSFGCLSHRSEILWELAEKLKNMLPRWRNELGKRRSFSLVFHLQSWRGKEINTWRKQEMGMKSAHFNDLKKCLSLWWLFLYMHFFQLTIKVNLIPGCKVWQKVSLTKLKHYPLEIKVESKWWALVMVAAEMGDWKSGRHVINTLDLLFATSISPFKTYETMFHLNYGACFIFFSLLHLHCIPMLIILWSSLGNFKFLPDLSH